MKSSLDNYLDQHQKSLRKLLVATIKLIQIFLRQSSIDYSFLKELQEIYQFPQFSCQHLLISGQISRIQISRIFSRLCTFTCTIRIWWLDESLLSRLNYFLRKQSLEYIQRVHLLLIINLHQGLRRLLTSQDQLKYLSYKQEQELRSLIMDFSSKIDQLKSTKGSQNNIFFQDSVNTLLKSTKQGSCLSFQSFVNPVLTNNSRSLFSMKQTNSRSQSIKTANSQNKSEKRFRFHKSIQSKSQIIKYNKKIVKNEKVNHISLVMKSAKVKKPLKKRPFLVMKKIQIRFNKQSRITPIKNSFQPEIPKSKKLLLLLRRFQDIL